MPNTQPNTVVSFDFGTKRMGVAVGQRITQSASPLKAIPAKDGIPNWDLIEHVFKEWQPDAIVVGNPMNMDGTESKLSVRAKKFANRINARFGLPVHFFDERLTTREAKTIAAEYGHKGNYADDPVDGIAAQLLLESWWRENI